MSLQNTPQVMERVLRAAETVLSRDRHVGPLELLQEMRILQPVHVQCWRKGQKDYESLDRWIQCGPAKLQAIYQYFQEWVRANNLTTVTASYDRASARDTTPLQITADGAPEQETFFRTHFAPRDLSPAQERRLNTKLNKVPDLVVFQKVSEDGQCVDCGKELYQGNLLFMENQRPLCLECADLDHLEFLPSGDMAMTRRARKHSPLSAVVVRFNRRRKRYERQGLLVTRDAIEQADEECQADADKRAQQRVRAVALREKEDHRLVDEMTRIILEHFPGCPPAEARQIASHTAQRHSGRVGRSAAGRALDTHAVELAVIAHIRHAHTRYDQLLMQGTDRQDARTLVREKIDNVRSRWSSKP